MNQKRHNKTIKYLIMNQLPKAKTSEILVQELENELLVYDLKTNKAFCLNETSAIVFQLCDGTKTVAEISQMLNQNLKQFIKSTRGKKGKAKAMTFIVWRSAPQRPNRNS